MPYIDIKLRPYYDALLDKISENRPSVGELNYIITKLCLNFSKQTRIDYATYNTIVGLLECVKLEFYRRFVVLYEDRKLKENGDIQ